MRYIALVTLGMIAFLHASAAFINDTTGAKIDASKNTQFFWYMAFLFVLVDIASALRERK